MIMILRFFCFSFIFICYTCSCQTHKQGFVYLSAKIFNPETGSYQIPKYYNAEEHKTWFYDSSFIQEATITDQSFDLKNNETWNNRIDRYIHCNLKSKVCYDYKGLSTDSNAIRNYDVSDSIRKIFIWPFYEYRNIWKADTTFDYPDTVMRGIAFKRIKGYIRHADTTANATLIGYLRCDKKGTIFHLDRAFDEKNECPLVAIEIIESKIRQYYEIIFARDCLTKEEEAIFDAWEKNSKEHPALPK